MDPISSFASHDVCVYVFLSWQTSRCFFQGSCFHQKTCRTRYWRRRIIKKNQDIFVKILRRAINRDIFLLFIYFFSFYKALYKNANTIFVICYKKLCMKMQYFTYFSYYFPHYIRKNELQIISRNYITIFWSMSLYKKSTTRKFNCVSALYCVSLKHNQLTQIVLTKINKNWKTIK